MIPVYSDTQRMTLRSQVKLAGEIIAGYWPMRTFVHHNPLHELETSAFDEAIQRARRLRGGQGYLHNEQYRQYVQRGRIRVDQIDAVLRAFALQPSVCLGEREVTHLEVLRAHLIHGISAPANENLERLCEREPERGLLTALMDRLEPVLAVQSAEDRCQQEVREDLAALGRTMTLSAWCDRTFGTALVARTNAEMIRWSAAFLDEGQAAWSMPQREQSLYGAWKSLAPLDLKAALWGLRGWAERVAALPDRSEDAILEALTVLGIPEACRVDYLSLQLAALPGWTAFIKWRGEQQGYAWQQDYPADLVKYLAIRLFYERQWLEQAGVEEFGIPGAFEAMRTYMELHPLTYYVRVQRIAGRLPVHWSRQLDQRRHRWSKRVDRGGNDDLEAWDRLAGRYLGDSEESHRRAAFRSAAWRLLRLTEAMAIAPTALLQTSPEGLVAVLRWLEAFPETQHGPVWLEAFEAGYHEPLLDQIQAKAASSEVPVSGESAADVRPQAQAVFCIDVRSEPVRRHLESIGNCATFGFAGFFICFIRYRALGSHHETDQYPVIAKARNVVREIPRSYHGEMLTRHQAGARLFRAVDTLLHDLKEHVITPYVMVETIGWFYSVPFFAKSLFPLKWRQVRDWFKRLVAPPVATTLTVDKLAKSEAEEMVASEQRATIRRAVRERLGLHGSLVTTEFVEALRRRALNGEEPDELFRTLSARIPNCSTEDLIAFIDGLRTHYRIDPRWAAAQKERIARTGFTLDEQIFTVETALRMMGLTRNFARLVLFCAHGSTSENNPFESALDCGACGGNEGKPNARLLAAMANKPQVRERLAKNGLRIPPDTHFLSGQIDTTTDEIQCLDLEDVPPTHRKDLVQLLEDIREAGRLTSQERCAKLPDVAAVLPLPRATEVRRRSSDWSQVRPEWGLSGNASFIIARRQITKALDLEGRAFLHSYNYEEDQTGRLLEIVMTAPQVVTQWINMEHYFSTVDNEVYGSGSKIYHNVVGRIGIMSGTQSDLRTGLAWQTVMNGEIPYHEPMRLLTVIEAPRTRIEQVIRRHELLQGFYHNGWVHLVALEPEEGALYRYLPTGEWRKVAKRRS
jgi:uncharacterized protein